MQMFPATPQIGPLGATEGTAWARRAGSYPANGEMFRAALTAARQGTAEPTTGHSGEHAADEPIAEDVTTDEIALAATSIADMIPLWLPLLAPPPAPVQVTVQPSLPGLSTRPPRASRSRPPPPPRPRPLRPSPAA